MTTTVLAYIPSPSQGVWHLGPLPIRAYAFFIIIGIVAALIIGDRRWQQRGGEPGVVYDMVFWAVGFGLVGGRLYHVITDWDKYFSSTGAGLVGALRIWDGGLGIWGAVALGGVGAWIGCRRRAIPLPAFGDAIAPGIILAQAIGRLGNYFNQELYGGPTTLPWGLEIYERRDAAGFIDSLNGVSTGQLVGVVHPTFLYELLWNLLVFAALIFIDRRFNIGHGRLFALYVAGYCFGRFWIELIRVDEATDFAGIRVNSFTSTFVFIGAVVYIMVAPKGREDPATLKGKPRDVGEEKDEDTSAEEFVKELTGVAAATTGVVAAAKVAGEAEDQDAEAAADDEVEPEVLSEAAAEGEALVEDVDEASSQDIAEAEEFAHAKEEAEQAEEGAEPGEEPEAEEPEPDSESEAGSVGGVGAVEGVEAVEVEQAAAEAHEVAVDVAGEAEDVAAQAEVGEEPEPEPADETAAVGAGEPEEIAEGGEDESGSESEAGSVGGVGAVEGVEAVEVEQAAAEAHEVAVDAAGEAEDVAADAEPGEEPEAEEPESADETAAVEDTEGEPSEEDAASDAKPSDDNEAVEEVAAAEESGEQAQEAGGRLRRWLRSRRG